MIRQSPPPERGYPVQVLLVEDDAVAANLVHDQLEATSDRYRCVPVGTLAAAVASLDAGGAQIALVDLGLPDSAGLDTLRIILEHADGVPVVVLTGLDNPDLGQAAIAAGAQDYIVKGVDRHRLAQVLDYALERQCLLARLADSETTFRTAFADAPTGVVTVSVAAGTAGRFLQVNNAMCELSGYPADELLSMTVTDITHPDDLAETRDMFRRAATGALSRFRVEKRYLRTDGGIVWVSTNGTVVPDRAGHPAYVIAHVEDITARRQAEQALADSELRFRSAFFDAPIGMVMISLDAANAGRYLKVNQAFCDIVGYSAEALAMKRFADITHPEDRAADVPFLAQLVDGRLDRVRREKRYVHPDGTVVWVIERVSTIRDEHGTPLYTLQHIEDITARRQAQEQLTHQALHDPLTGLGNRHLLMARLQHSLDALDRTAGEIAVLYIDLDGFKAVNDRVGHDGGDRFLIEIGRRLQHAVRRPDTAIRLGGDEFIAVVPDVHHDALLRIVERIKTTIAEPIPIGTETFTVSASVGVVVTRDSHDDPNSLVCAADLAMYRAKQQGRGRYEIFTDALRAQAMQRLHLEHELRHAIEGDLLRLHYQPIVEVASSLVVGVETLLRLQHPTRGLLTPEAFLDVAETTGLIVPIGDWVIGQACRQQAVWQESLPGHLQMAVNLSGRQVLQFGICDRIAAAIDDAGIDPHRLTIELTETVFTEASRSFLTDLDALKARGVRFALDDFGTGYSSLAYLERFPADIVKIDQRFVAGLGTNPHDTTIVTAIINLGHTLHLTVVAEGVETHVQLAALQDLGCDLAQGFYVARPSPPERIPGLLASIPKPSRRSS